MSKNEYEDVFQSCPNGLYRTSISTGEFIKVNQALATLLGYSSPEEMKENITAKDLYAHEDDRKKFIQYLKDNNGKCLGEYNIKFLDKDKNEVWVMVTGKINETEGFIDGAIIDLNKNIETQINTLSEITKITKKRIKEIDESKFNFKIRA